MTNYNAQIYTTSLNNVTKRIEAYGDGNILDLSLLRLCYKYASFSNDHETLKRLDSHISELQMNNPDICMDISNGNHFPFGIDVAVIVPSRSGNTAPEVNDNSVLILANEDSHVFSFSEFLSGYNSSQGNSPSYAVIKSVPSGVLLYDGTQVLAGQKIDVPSLLIYERSSTSSSTDTFNFSIFDDNQDDPKESTDTVMTVNVDEADNKEATIGDGVIYPTNRAVTVLTLNMFTTYLIAPYSDPEGDLIDAIRIDDISNANKGVYQINGSDVSIGDVISREDIEAGLFTHTGADTDNISTDSLTFSARDEVSRIWVQ